MEHLDHTAASEGDFLRIVRVNEGIKTIADLSFHIRLRALNALVTSLQSSDTVDGMAVVAGQMIEFSIELERQARDISKTTHQILIYQTLLVKSRKKRSYFTNTYTQIARQHSKDSAVKQTPVDRILGRFSEYTGSMHSIIAADMSLFARMISQFLRLLMTGRVLGTLGKIEAAHTKKNSGYFSELAKNFDSSLNTIEEVLKGLEDEIRSLK
jgi:hypothetical protein